MDKMKKILCGLKITCVLILCGLPYVVHADISDQVRADLQMTLLKHIKGASSNPDRLFRVYSSQINDVVGYRFNNLHPVIIERDEAFVLCVDFKDKNGDKVEIDFVLISSGAQFQVTQTILNNRKNVMSYFRYGKK
ncbi:MAG: hypothetical protein V7750_11150 [Sneathiella sp.]